MRIIHSNLIYAASLSASSNKLGYGVSLLKDRMPFTRLKTNGKAEEYIVIDLGSAKAVSGFAAIKHNLTDEAICLLEANTSDSWGTPAFSVPLTLCEGSLSAVFPAQRFQFWRLLLQDPNNSEYLELGELYIGTSEELGYVSTDGVLNAATVDSKSVTRSGSVLGRKGYSLRSFAFNLAFLSPEKRHALKKIYTTHGVTEPVVIVVWEEALALEPPAYCVFDAEVLSFKRRGTRAFITDTSISFTEVL